MSIRLINSVAAFPLLLLNRRILLLALGCVLAFVTGCAPVQVGTDQSKDFNVNLVELKDAKYKNLPVAEGGLSAEVRAEIDAEVLEFMASKPVPIAGCAIAITRNNQIAYLQGYGKADLAANRDFTIATPSAIGSISKTLTALGLMALVEDDPENDGVGKLDLDAPVLDQMAVVPGVDTGWTDNPTLRDVLAHKGGFIEGTQPVWNAAAFTDGPTMAAAFPNIDFPSLEPVLVYQSYKSEAGNQLPAQLGTPTYSNVGYSLLGALLDYRSKLADIPSHMRGYERFIWHRVARGTSSAEPTMITACLATDFRTSDIKNLAKGYAQDGSSLSFGDWNSIGWGWEGPSGGWVLTIGDLARLMLIMQSDAVIPKATIDSQMRQDHGDLFNDGTDTGLGLELAGDDSWFGKGGDILGYTADFKVWPSQFGTDWGVAFICNQSGTGKQLTGNLKAIVTGTAPGGQSGGGQQPGEGQQQQVAPDPLVELAKQYEPLVRQIVGRHLAQSKTPDEAWRRAKKELAGYPNGSRLIELLERGELASALRLLPNVVYSDGALVR
jgi:CubicO group peptidase (beta-lactamase class C family)